MHDGGQAHTPISWSSPLLLPAHSPCRLLNAVLQTATRHLVTHAGHLVLIVHILQTEILHIHAQLLCDHIHLRLNGKGDLRISIAPECPSVDLIREVHISLILHIGNSPEVGALRPYSHGDRNPMTVIGSVVSDDPCLPGQNSPIFLYPCLDVDDHRIPQPPRGKLLILRIDDPNRPSRLPREKVGDDLHGIHLKPSSESPTHIDLDHLNFAKWKPKDICQHFPIRMENLSRYPDRQPSRLIEIDNTAMGLQAAMGLGLGLKSILKDMIRLPEGLLHISIGPRYMNCHIPLFMDLDRLGFHRLQRVKDTWQF